MKIKNNKGYVAIDASIAVLILLIIIPTIAGMIYNVNKSNNFIERKTEAINIAVNTIEIVKGIGANGELNETTVRNNIAELYTLTEEDVYTMVENINDKINSITGTITNNENTYKIKIDIQDYANTQEATDKQTETGIEIESGLVKIVEVTVEYRSGKETKSIKLNTAIS